MADPPNPLAGVLAKLDRAERHLKLAKEIDRVFSREKCGVRPEFNPKTNEHDFIVRLAEPPVDLSLTFGDAIHNIRTALDHLAWALVLANPDRPAGTPNRSTMFPICDTREGYLAQVKKNRVRGIVPDAVTEIEGLQPYIRRNFVGRDYKRHPLWILDALENVDKHRRLTLTTFVGVGGTAELLIDGQLVTMIKRRGGQLFRNGTVLASFKAPRDAQKKVRVQGYISVVIALNEPDHVAADLPAISVIAQIIEYIRKAVVPSLTPFVTDVR